LKASKALKMVPG